MPSLLREAGSQLRFETCEWFSTYRIHHRAARRFRTGRCFLLGDAAHIHSPMGAQGMNTGLQDAYNLGWKLGHVINGAASEDLLETYEAERLPVAQHLLRTTDRMFRLIVSDNPMVGLMRTKVAARIASLAMRHERMQNFAFHTISQLGIRYRKSQLSQTLDELPKNAPAAGDRFPWLHLQFDSDGSVEDAFEKLDDTCFNLLVFGQSIAPGALAEFGPLLKVHAMPHTANHAELTRAGIPATSFYLLRPDGHIGLCGKRLDVAAVERYLSERVKLARGTQQYERASLLAKAG